MTDLRVFRMYEPWECGKDGYPLVWHENAGVPPDTFDGVKHLVRDDAGGRCERCGHPYEPGVGVMEDQRERIDFDASTIEYLTFVGMDGVPTLKQMSSKHVFWSPCDARCTHAGPIRWRTGENDTGWFRVEADREATDYEPGSLVRTHLASVAPYPAGAVEAAWRILTVHHLNGVKADLRWWNLASLCQRCHLHIQRKVQMERVYPFEHTDWFKPHAAGWYAYAYKGLNLTRDQALEALPDLLELERMA